MTDGSRGLLPADPSFVPDEQEKDGPTWKQIILIALATLSAQAIFIAWLETF